MKYLFFIVSFFLVQTLFSQSSTETFFDFDYTDYMTDIVDTDNGGYLIVSYSKFDSYYFSIQNLIKIDENGNVLEIISDSTYLGNDVVQYDDSTFYFAGTLYSDSYITKTDSEYNIIWQDVNHSDNSYYSNYQITKLNDNYLAYIEVARPLGTEWPQLRRDNIIDTSGQLMNETPHYSYGLTALNDSVFYEFGQDNWDDSTSYVTLRKLSSTMPFEQDTTYNFNKLLNVSNYNNQVITNSDTTYVINNPKYTDSVVIMATDANSGDSLFTKYIHLNERPYLKSVCITDNNELLILGYMRKNGVGGNYNAFILKTNSVGDSISISYIDKFFSLLPIKIVSKGDFMFILGNIKLDETNYYLSDGYLLKAPIDTVMVSTRQYQSNEFVGDNFKVFPNPANSYISISLRKNNYQDCKIVVNDIFGREVLNKNIPMEKSELKIDISNQKNGIYFISLFEKGKLLQTEKVVVNH